MPPIPTTEKRPFIPAPGVMQAEMVYTVLGQRCENVYHFLQGDGATPPTTAEMNAVAAALNTWENAQGINMRSRSCSLVDIVVRDLTTESSPAVDRVPTGTVVGAAAIDGPPNNVTVAVKWLTALRGRSYRGRTYHVGMNPNYYVGNVLTGSAITDLRTRYDALRTSLETLAGVQMVVLSYASHKFWRDIALATRIISVAVDPDLDSQRRRLAGRGQ